MIKKRIIAVVNVKKNIVVQSFSFKNYLPIGQIEYTVENLNRWQVDEILIQSVDRSVLNEGPNFDLIYKLKKLNISTPIIYGGGVRSLNDCLKLIDSGIERILIDNLLHFNLNEIAKISQTVGAQSLIASLPILFNGNKFLWFDYKSMIHKEFNSQIIKFIDSGIFSEALIVDYKNEGIKNNFNDKILNFKIFKKINLILFGGISESYQIKNILKEANISAVGIGNFLYYKEFSYQKLKEDLKKISKVKLRNKLYSNRAY
jgi:cyclase